MSSTLRHVDPKTVIAGIDFGTGSTKGIAFDLTGMALYETRLPTVLETTGGVSEMDIDQIAVQAAAYFQRTADALLAMDRLDDWATIGISATHHTAARIDRHGAQVRRAICWNDPSLADYQARGLARLGGQAKACQLTGGPWASRYTLSHLLKDEERLGLDDWRRTWRIVSHGSLAAGFLTGNFDSMSVSSAASTGIMDLRTGQWALGMLDALASPDLRRLAAEQLPPIVDSVTPVGSVSTKLSQRCPMKSPPLVFPTSDDQQAGLAGGGAVEPGELAIILGNSAVVNGSSASLPTSGMLDVMRLNWGPYLWMRCYNNGAQFLDTIVGLAPDWEKLEAAAKVVPPGCNGASILPFAHPEPSRGVHTQRLEWRPIEPADIGIRFRASLEALAYLIALGVREHEQSGQRVKRVVLSGGIARSQLMGEILASVLRRPLERLQSSEGPALGAAVVALWGLENHRRKQVGEEQDYSIADAVRQVVKYREPVQPVAEWSVAYEAGLREFEKAIG